MQRALVLLALCVGAALGAYTFPVHRGVQYLDARGAHGPQRGNLNLPAALPGGAVDRRCVVVAWDALTPAVVSELIARGAQGLLVVLPRPDAPVTRAQRVAWSAVDRWLLAEPLKIPVFFAEDSEDVRALQQRLATSFAALQLTVPGPVEAPLVVKPQVSSVHGWLQGLSDETAHLPTILVAAHYDTLASAGGLATGANDNGSGVVALLELARLFSRLYRQPRDRVGVNFLFAVTGGAHVNFHGTTSWLAHMDAEVMQRVDVAVCLDTLAGDSAQLFMHYSRPPKTPKVKGVYDLLRDHAHRAQVPLDQRRKKVNMASPDLAWPHEALARSNLFAVTLSGAESFGAESSALDSVARVNMTTLQRNVALVAETLAKHAFGFAGHNFDVFEGSLAPDTESMRALLEQLAHGPRVDAWMDKTKPHAALDLIRARLGALTERMQVRHYDLPAAVKFHAPSPLTLTAHESYNTLFDLVLLLGAAAYLLIVYQALELAINGALDWTLLARVRAASSAKRVK